ncbi:MAG: nucleotide sugar dehydrogenase [Flavobacteriaceae bacterium]
MKKITIIGLGYVGLPLAIEFGKKFDVLGYDISKSRINELINGIDSNGEFKKNEILKEKINFTHSENEIRVSEFYIITVPTPLKKSNKPDLGPLKNASKIVGKKIKKGDIVIYESTVYPGCTEDECVPILVKNSGLVYNVDFFCGYSPERINPGDKKRKLSNIKKVVSGSNSKVSKIVNELYSEIINAGTYIAPSIKVAEASKIIENVQRDVNISLMNEFALIFEKLNIDTKEVLDAASTKWNFLNFKPGLVGGHCIGVDPYYLAYKSEKSGYKPKVLLNGRKVNNNISKNIFKSIQRECMNSEIDLKKCRVLILGITFKENCSDTRNSRVVNLYNHFKKLNNNIDVYDPYADKDEVYRFSKIKLIESVDKKYDVVVLAVAHNQFLSINYNNILNKNYVLYDVKSVLPKKLITLRL